MFIVLRLTFKYLIFILYKLFYKNKYKLCYIYKNKIILLIILQLNFKINYKIMIIISNNIETDSWHFPLAFDSLK